MVGFSEEFGFRGYAQFTLTKGIGFWPSALIISVGFGSAHLFNPGENWRGAVEIAVFALLLCLVLRRTGNLWFTVGLHAAWDWSEAFFYGVPGGMTVNDSLMRSSLHGPAWMTGVDGIEGGVVTLVVTLILMALIHLRFREVRYRTP